MTDYERRIHLAAWEHANKRLAENRRERRMFAMIYTGCIGLGFVGLGAMFAAHGALVWVTLMFEVVFGLGAGASWSLVNRLTVLDQGWRESRDWHAARMYGDNP